MLLLIVLKNRVQKHNTFIMLLPHRIAKPLYCFVLSNQIHLHFFPHVENWTVSAETTLLNKYIDLLILITCVLK